MRDTGYPFTLFNLWQKWQLNHEAWNEYVPISLVLTELRTNSALINPVFFWNKIQLDLSLIRREENIRIVFIVHHWERYVKYNDVYSFEAQMTSEVLRHRFRTWFVLQPKMFSSCDALPYHWNPTSMAERVGLPPCNGSPTLNIFTHRFSVPSLVAMWEWRSDRWRCGWQIIPHVVALTELVATALDRQRWRTLSQSASSALEEERRHHAQSARERRHLAACIPATNANFQCPDCARLCKSRIGLQSHSRTHR